MRALVLLVGLPVALSLVLGVTTYLTSDRGGLTAALRKLVEADTDAVKLEGDLKDAQVVSQRRAEVLNDVIERRCSLFEAAARLRDLDKKPANFSWGTFRVYYSAASNEEAHCRQVIRDVTIRLQERADWGLPVIRCLETELKERLKRGPIELPSTDNTPRNTETDRDP
jgi:hypothetical protein